MTESKKSAKHGEHGEHGEHVQGTIRQDEVEAFERLRAELAHAYDAPDDTYCSLNVDMVIRRNS